ncbi:hypothetical protein [Methanosarcina sp. DH2]|nr:hypothetical protein [Methanosarcina sp. DH2]
MLRMTGCSEFPNLTFKRFSQRAFEARMQESSASSLPKHAVFEFSRIP